MPQPPDGACMYHTLAAAERLHTGNLVADAQTMRATVHCGLEKWVASLEPEAARELAIQVRLEMIDDPSWSHRGKWSWPKYLGYASQPFTFGTWVNIVAYVRESGVSAVVMQEADGSPGK